MNEDFSNVDFINGILTIINIDGTMTCIPEKDCLENQQAMIDAFRVAFPDGKPIIPTEPQVLPPTTEERFSAIEDILMMLLV